MEENMQQSISLALSLLIDGWTVSGEVDAETLRRLYEHSHTAFLPAEFGQERAVLEARSMGLDVIVQPDNPKLQELATSSIYDVEYYAQQLKKGIDGLR